MKASALALFVACLALVVVFAACSSGMPVAPATGASATIPPTATSILRTAAATPSPVPAPDIPVADAGQTLCFACHGPGELPSIPDHSVMQDGRAVCEQCHKQGK